MVWKWIAYRHRIRFLEKKIRRLQARYGALVNEAVISRRPAEEKAALLGGEFQEVVALEEAIDLTISNYLIATARTLRISTPSYSDDGCWKTSHYTGMPYLAEDARERLQAAIRNEQKERLQLWELRVKIIAPALTASVGLIGALIGLVAIFKK